MQAEGNVEGPASVPPDVEDSGTGVPSASDIDADAFLEVSEAAFCASSACSFASRALILLSALYDV